ncbi:cupredoxin domain-containing protein [uncultured Arthrobacter sp.]|uniref:cupredoxin domain-containing protein n=1 Tax=uncultured Arthrobacter sp. TaxID=114050 RepID=UPI0025D656F4|nr:cupredoxin domain-containing protein [uncultured Arthrobacter sp.]
MTIAAVLIGGAGLGSAAATVASPGPVSQAVPAMTAGKAIISIDNFMYSGPGTVAPGAQVTVTNNDTEAHTVTADDGSFDITIPGGASAAFTAPSGSGSYGYFCQFHGNMRGTLTVGAEAAAPAPAAPASPGQAAPAPVAPEAAAPGSAGHSGMDQMGAMPKGGADTGAVTEDTSGQATLIALGGGLVLLAAAGGTYAVRRRSTN